MANALIIRGIDSIISDLGRFEQLFESNRRKVLLYAAVPLIDAIKSRAPVGRRVHKRYSTRKGRRAKRGQGNLVATYYPGNLRGSINVLTNLRRNDAVNVGPKYSRAKVLGKSRFDGYYAGMVEFGTKYRGRRRFVQPAIDVAAPQVRRRIELGFQVIANKYK